MSADLPTSTPPAVRRRSCPRPVTVRRRQAAGLVSMSQAAFDRADAAGLIPAGHKVGGCKMWSVAELKAWASHGCLPRSEWTHRWAVIRDRRR